MKMSEHANSRVEKGSKFWIECGDCQFRTPYDPLQVKCPACESDWRFARYDLGYAKRAFAKPFAQREHELWRYRELLPLDKKPQRSGLQEGWTPLFRAEQLGLLLGLDQLYIKDERQGPTNSFKDRQAAVSTAVLLEHALHQAVICSTGNVAMAFSASCARAGIQLWGFLTSLVPLEKMHEVAVYGTKVVKVTGMYDQAKKLAAEFAHQRGLYLDRGVRSIAAVESMKTIAFEIAEQLTQVQDASSASALRSPDWYIQAVSSGLGPIGVSKGFQELYDMGLIASLPAMGIIQAEGCAPMVHAWKAGKTLADPILEPKTHITTLTTGDPGRSYTHLRERLLASGGAMESVTDEETFRALHLIAKLEGISVEPAAAAAFAGTIKLARQGIFKRNDLIVINCSGHAMPAEAHLLAPGWAQDINAQDYSLPDQPREGLFSALTTLAESTDANLLIVDDDADARRLIRRVLESQGSYRIREAENGIRALQEFDDHRPDLVILDLMMPGMDGFSVLEEMKAKSEEVDIPIIIVTAKELTPIEQASLEGRIKGLLIKGDFLGDELVGQIDNSLE
jgi:threonine synthase